MKKYYNRKATEQPRIEVGDWVMLNAGNIRTKLPLKEFSPIQYASLQVLEKKGSGA